MERAFSLFHRSEPTEEGVAGEMSGRLTLEASLYLEHSDQIPHDSDEDPAGLPGESEPGLAAQSPFIGLPGILKW